MALLSKLISWSIILFSLSPQIRSLLSKSETRKEAEESPEEASEQALLTEYKVCEQDNAANFQGFWTLAAIFFGLTSVFLAGLIYAVIANESLFSIVLYHNEPKKTFVIGIIALIIGIANVVILRKLKGWHRRIMFNQGLNLRRMCEIEVLLGMRKSLRVRGIEDWKELEQELNEFEKEQKNKDKFEKIKRKLREWCQRKRESKEYEPSSSRKHFPCILRTLMGLWGLVILGAIYIIVISAIKFCQ